MSSLGELTDAVADTYVWAYDTLLDRGMAEGDDDFPAQALALMVVEKHLFARGA